MAAGDIYSIGRLIEADFASSLQRIFIFLEGRQFYVPLRGRLIGRHIHFDIIHRVEVFIVPFLGSHNHIGLNLFSIIPHLGLIYAVLLVLVLGILLELVRARGLALVWDTHP